MKLITAATAWPVTLSEAKEHCGIVGDTSHDTRITRLIKAATEYCERYCGRTFPVQTWEYQGPCWIREIPLPPLQSIVHVKFYDSDNELQTLSTDDYRVILSYEGFGIIEPTEIMGCWPSVYPRSDAVQIRFTAGYSPEVVKQAVLLLVGAWDQNRQGEVTGTITARLELGVKALLDSVWHGGYF